MPPLISIQTRLRKAFPNANVYEVRTSRTVYQVVVGSDEIYVVGPGVEKTYRSDQFDSTMSDEGQATAAVLHWEEAE